MKKCGFLIQETMINNMQQEETPDLSALMEFDLFSKLLPEEKKILANKAEVIHLRSGSSLFSVGDKAERLYLLRKGLIRIFKPKGSEDEEIARFTPGDVIGDFDFARSTEYNAQAQALEDSTLIMFPGFGQTMDSLELVMPDIVSRLLLNSAVMVTSRIKSTRKLVAENMSLVRELHRKVYEDPGTGLWKHTFLTDEIDRIMEAPMALIMLKPDRFKILVDALGHGAGDKAMIAIAGVLKSITFKLRRGWALRFRSNETGILINKCNAAQAEALALSLAEAIAALAPVSLAPSPSNNHTPDEKFSFSGSIAWGMWPADNESWPSLSEGVYELLMETWKDGGNKIARYSARSSI